MFNQNLTRNNETDVSDAHTDTKLRVSFWIKAELPVISTMEALIKSMV